MDESAAATTGDKRTRLEIEAVIRKAKDERNRLEAQREAHKRANRDYARSVIKLVALEATDLDALTEFAERQHMTTEYTNITDALDTFEAEYQRVRYSAGEIKDKQQKAKIIDAAKAKRDASSGVLKARLSELSHVGQLIAPAAPVPRKQISTAEYKATMEAIHRIWGERKAMVDPLTADLEVGKLCKRIGEDAKALKHFLNAVQPYKAQKNLVVELTDDDWTRIKHSEQARMREAHSLLFHIYLKTTDRESAEAHMRSYLELSTVGSQRTNALKYLEKLCIEIDGILVDSAWRGRLLSKYCGVMEVEPSKKLNVSDSILVTNSLGRLPDLRLAILKELNLLFPNDPYLLESLGLMHVRLRDYGTASQTMVQYVALPQVSTLPLFAQVLEYTPPPHFRSLSQGNLSHSE
ncbi:hypothetical protein AaE_006993 [Aphanomyces astaci]|uniref:Uncharacterized protein n=1 Tax=Aphanomyces astaci TaxID=112090 RepID=A0A6A4ZYQ2_APHAT|nr:hypothetical protein AaE_006993 [Aphanomyces astaci]